MKVDNTVQAYEIMGLSKRFGEVGTSLHVRSHWNVSDYVVLEFPEGQTITVLGSELEKAIRNARNV